jgi:succinate dehydrogenase/fumarate reductase flavoprotein subunit
VLVPTFVLHVIVAPVAVIPLEATLLIVGAGGAGFEAAVANVKSALLTDFPVPSTDTT